MCLASYFVIRIWCLSRQSFCIGIVDRPLGGIHQRYNVFPPSWHYKTLMELELFYENVFRVKLLGLQVDKVKGKTRIFTGSSYSQKEVKLVNQLIANPLIANN